MAITPKEKELAAVGISVATGCKPCTDHHMKAVRKARASDKEIRQTVADALEARKGARRSWAHMHRRTSLKRQRSILLDVRTRSPARRRVA